MQLLAVLALAAATISGKVTFDDAALPGCTVRVQSPSGMERVAISNVEGNYRIEGLEPGEYKLKVELAGFEPVERDTVLVEGHNEQPSAELELLSYTTIAIVCDIKPCSNDMPASPWDGPWCSDYDFDTLLLDAIDRGDDSAIALVQRRYDTATTYHQKHRLAAALLGRVGDDSAYWDELFEHAANAVRFAGAGDTFTEELKAWCSDRGIDAETYFWMAFNALGLLASDERARSLLLEGLESSNHLIVWTAVMYLAEQRDERALGRIETALERLPDDAPNIAMSLAAYLSEDADRIAFRFIAEDQRAEYGEMREQTRRAR